MEKKLRIFLNITAIVAFTKCILSNDNVIFTFDTLFCVVIFRTGAYQFVLENT